MNASIPPDERIRIWLNPQNEAEENVIAYMATTMRRQLPLLADMLYREFQDAMRAAGLTGRRECLLAVAEVMAEVHGIETVHETLSGLEGGGE